MPPRPFRIGFPREYLLPDGSPMWPGLGREGLEGVSGLEVSYYGEAPHGVTAAMLRPYDAVVATSTPFTAESFQDVDRLTLIARYGVGYDAVDLAAATRAGVLVTITRGAADRPVAEGALTLILALGHRLVALDARVRSGRWRSTDRTPSTELRDRTIGIVGFGGIGRELARLLQPFGAAAILAADPQPDHGAARALGVEIVDLDTLLRASDVLSIHCHLTPATRGLIGRRELGLMKPTALLVNTARGPIVDQEALTEALRDGRLRGAALDVFREEPLPLDDPLIRLENVILTPHAISVTEELHRDYHRACVRSLLAVKAGRVPEHVVNPAVLGTPQLEEKLARLREEEEARR
jgi:phosphoglycerate dehydrogenase-like enzyme